MLSSLSTTEETRNIPVIRTRPKVAKAQRKANHAGTSRCSSVRLLPPSWDLDVQPTRKGPQYLSACTSLCLSQHGLHNSSRTYTVEESGHPEFEPGPAVRESYGGATHQLLRCDALSRAAV